MSTHENGPTVADDKCSELVFSEASNRVTYLSRTDEEPPPQKMCIRAGTVERLVEWLAPMQEDPDPSYLSCFLWTYRTFLTPSKLLDMLTQRYLEVSNSTDYTSEEQFKILKRLVSFIKVWLDQYPGDFNVHPNYETLNQLKNFCHKHFQGDSQKEICQLCEQLRKKFLSLRISVSGEYDFDPREEINFPTFGLYSLDAQHLAEQLTDITSTLFCKIVPHECLSFVLNQKSREQRRKHAPSVCATIDQFNQVSLAVIATVLQATDSVDKHCCVARGRALNRWIEVAQHCRWLKNFTSIKAILAGLQSSPIHRLKKSWAHVPSENLTLFDELSSVFAADSNSQSSRELLDKEGTAKFSTIDKKKNRYSGSSAVNGVVPWLGTFITDLTMIDTANPDHTPEGYINFEKSRKFFEVLAKIALYQKAATNYHLAKEPAVKHWLTNLQIYSCNESYALSKVLEPSEVGSDSPQSASSLRKKFRNLFGTKAADEFAFPFTPPASTGHTGKQTKLSASPSKVQSATTPPCNSPNAKSNGSTIPTGSPIPPETRVIRVTMGTNKDCVYKSLLLKENYKTIEVIQLSLEKLGMDETTADQYDLVQLIEKKTTGDA